MQIVLPNNLLQPNGLAAAANLQQPNNVVYPAAEEAGGETHEAFNVFEGIFNVSEGAFNVREN